MSMDLATGTKYAGEIVKWVTPFCVRVMVAGSIRRERPTVNDVDVICIPRVEEHRDLLGAVAARENLLLSFLQEYVKERNPIGTIGRKPRFVSGGEKEGKQIVMELPKCQLDLWFASEENFASRLLMRTGSMDHNRWLAERFTANGYHWFPYEGVARLEDLREKGIEPGTPGAGDRAREAGLIKKDLIEQELYRRAGMQWIEPKDREIGWLMASAPK